MPSYAKIRNLFRDLVLSARFQVNHRFPTLFQEWQEAPGLRLIQEGEDGGGPGKWSREFFESGRLEGGVKTKDS